MAKRERQFSMVKFGGRGVEVMVHVVTDGENRGQFKAEFANEKFQEESFAALERKLAEFISEVSRLNWLAVLAVKIRTESDHSEGEAREGVTLSYERFQAAKRPDGTWIRTAWENSGPDRLVRCQDLHAEDYEDMCPTPAGTIDFAKLPASARGRCTMTEYKEITHYLPYDEALFEGVAFVGAQIPDLRERLSNMIGSEKGQRLIERKTLHLLRESQSFSRRPDGAAGSGA